MFGYMRCFATIPARKGSLFCAFDRCLGSPPDTFYTANVNTATYACVLKRSEAELRTPNKNQFDIGSVELESDNKG
jgi:hypothetical protein